LRAPKWSRLPFLTAVALLAAAVADPFVETIANTGVLGSGYADNDHSSVIPTLIVGGLLALLVVGTRTWALALARRVVERAPLDDLPYVLVLQFVALFGMESVEQLLDGGHLLGGAIWLGGPVWFSVATHIAIGVACTLLVARAMRVIARRCATIVSVALDFILCEHRRASAAQFTRRCHDSTERYTRHVFVRQVGERAPPLLVTLI
jgi:hypothetical protein